MKFETDLVLDEVTIISTCWTKCTVAGDPYTARVAVMYEPSKYLLEFCKYEEWLRSMAQLDRYTIEELCVEVFEFLWNELKPVSLTVIVKGTSPVHSPATALKRREHAT